MNCSADGSERIDSKSYVSIIATTKVEVICMKRIDYARVSSNEMILKLLADRELLRIPIETLQKIMIERRTWELFKKREVDRIAS